MLVTLANATRPLTACRIATRPGVQRTKVNAELRRLAAANILKAAPRASGRALWQVSDPDIRRLIRRRARIAWSEDLVADAPRLAAQTRRVVALSQERPVDLRILKREFTPRNPEEFVRPPEKDALLRRLGLRVSRRVRGRP